MIVRTPNKVSVRRVVLLIIFLVLLSLIVSCCIIIHKGEGFYEYETQDEIKTVFKENIDEFDRYVEMFRHHDMWRKFYNETHDKDVVTYKGFKKYTTEDEYHFLEQFDKKYHPWFWEPCGVILAFDGGYLSIYKYEEGDKSVEFQLYRAKEYNWTVEYYENWVFIID